MMIISKESWPLLNRGLKYYIKFSITKLASCYVYFIYHTFIVPNDKQNWNVVRYFALL